MTRTACRLGLAAVLAAAAVATAQPPMPGVAPNQPGTPGMPPTEPWNTPAGADVKALENSPWKVTVEADRPDNTYGTGDEVFLKVTSEQPGFLYVFNVDPTGKIVCLFPNQFQADNAILP